MAGGASCLSTRSKQTRQAATLAGFVFLDAVQRTNATFGLNSSLNQRSIMRFS
jgi:hypothetical protein